MNGSRNDNSGNVKKSSAILNREAIRVESARGEDLVALNIKDLVQDGAKARNIQAVNGVVHQVDTVLAPPMRSAVKSVDVLEKAKTVSASPVTAPLETPPAAAQHQRRQSTIL